MLHAPNNHFVFQPGFQNRNQSRVHLFIGCKVRKLGPHIFLQSLFLRTCFFEGIKNLLTCSGVSSLPLPLCERLILLSPKEKSTDLMANSLFVAKIFHVDKSGLSSSPAVNFDLYNSIYVWSFSPSLIFLLRNTIQILNSFSVSKKVKLVIVYISINNFKLTLFTTNILL